MEALNIKLFSNYVILDLIPRNETKLIIPDTIKKSDDGTMYNLTVAGISNEKDDDGKLYIRNVKVGDVVLLSPHSAPVQTQFDDKKYLVVRETELIGVFIPKESEVVN
jgi:co-chaperonin GroES (HSP10)